LDIKQKEVNNPLYKYTPNIALNTNNNLGIDLNIYNNKN
jgi:hypothetical protein